MTQAAIHYLLDPCQQHAHLYIITLTIAQPAAGQELMLPVWIPGSYLIREFAKNLHGLRAEQNGSPVTIEALDKHRWRVDSQPGEPLQVQYQVVATDASVRTAWLDVTRGFFNGTSLCLCVCGQEQKPHALQILRPDPDWTLATGLPAVEIHFDGFGTYLAQNYDELVDCPVAMGCFDPLSFSVRGVPHSLAITGAPPPTFDSARLVADSQRICETVAAFWHGAESEGGMLPLSQYVFLLHASATDWGGLEHRNSTALVCPRSDLPRLGQDSVNHSYIQLLGLISHEYFHTWNVKRLRPHELSRYDYTRENHTPLLWFFEGFTSYYDDLLLRRADLINHETYLSLLAKNINQVQQTPGRKVHSVAQASWDAWTKFYRPDSNTPNTTVNYYTKGALVALCLDLTLRREGQTTLDDVMRALWQTIGDGPMREADLLHQLQRLSGRDFQPEIGQWVHSTQELPLAELLESQGIRMQPNPTAAAQLLARRLGLRTQEKKGSMYIQTVLRGSAAEAAGLMANDEWLALETPQGAWRIQQLEDVRLFGGDDNLITAIIAREQRLLHLPLYLPKPHDTDYPVRLHLSVPSLAEAWLGKPGASTAISTSTEPKELSP